MSAKTMPGAEGWLYRSRGARMALHTIGIISFSYSFKWLIDNPNHASTSSGWHFQYLTILGIAKLISCGINLTDQGWPAR